MISFNLHIPSIIVGFLLGYILVSIMWIITSTDNNWHIGFGEGYEVGRKNAEDEFKKMKNCKTYEKNEK